MRTNILASLAFCTVLLLPSCTDQDTKNIAEQPSFLNKDTIDISDVNVVLPDLPGRDNLEASCMPCHSLRYIQMQPLMTKAAWGKIVAKMMKNYGAPVRDSLVEKEIVDYLVRIKGVK